MKLTVDNKIFMGFGAVLALITLMSIDNVIKVGGIAETEHRLTNLRFPTVIAGIEVVDGIHRSLAGLRGYMILGDNPAAARKFMSERQEGWDLIDKAVQQLDVFSMNWTDPKNIEKLDRLKGLVDDFRIAQQAVEEISHSTENVPAVELLLSEVVPQSAKIFASLAAIIEEESILTTNRERKHLLKLVTDSRASFAIGLANIHTFLLTGDSQFEKKFKKKWQDNEASYKQIAMLENLFSNTQAQQWNTYKTLRSEFATIPPNMFKLRKGKDWNVANHWLDTKAAPKASVILDILGEMRASQNILAKSDQQSLEHDSASMKVTMVIGTLITLGLGVLISVWVRRTIKKSSELQGQLLNENRALVSNNLSILEDERKNLSRELHDEMGQLITAIKIDASYLGEHQQSPDTQSAVQDIITLCSQLLTSVQAITNRLRPSTLDQIGLGESLEELVNNWQQRNRSCTYLVELDENINGLNDQVNITLYRLLQEALNNIAKHSRATAVTISLHKNPTTRRMMLRIIDNGVGLDNGYPRTTLGLGVPGMRERTQSIGGDFRIKSAADQGTIVEVTLPFADTEEKIYAHSTSGRS